jgi:hypothetical protein
MSYSRKRNTAIATATGTVRKAMTAGIHTRPPNLSPTAVRATAPSTTASPTEVMAAINQRSWRRSAPVARR